MAFTPQIIPASTFLVTTASGDLDFPRARALLNQAVGEGQHESFGILLDFRGVSCLPLSSAQFWNLVQVLQDHPSLHWRRIAVLLGGDAQPARAEFFELCASNRGFQVQFFHEFEQALYWLMEPFDKLREGGLQKLS